MKRQDLDTPFVVIDMDKVERNITGMQKMADAAGVALRPHAKTHKIPALALKQVAAGAVGVTVAKVGEAEVMVDAGIGDILIAYPIVGTSKWERLARLGRKANVSVAVDSLEVTRGISQALEKAGGCIGVLIEIDCGFRRVGVAPGEPVLALARQVVQLPGLELKGIMTFAGHSYDARDSEERRRIGIKEGQTAVACADTLRAVGLSVDIVSVGSTPTSPIAAKVPGVTELRPGTYIFGDLMQVQMNVHSLDQCALTVKVTVVSRPAPERAVVDAGTKVLTKDGEDSPLGTGRGLVYGRPGICVEWLTEEHGMLKLAEGEWGLAVGDTLEIIPVHACAVVNMVDEVAFVRGDDVEAVVAVSARGKVR